jgi:hypothetical protein
METRHLTPDERAQIAAIVGDNLDGAFEVLMAVAGLVSNSQLMGPGEAEETAIPVRKAARGLKAKLVQLRTVG